MPNEVSNRGQPNWLRIILIGRRPKFTLVRVCVLAVTCFVVFGYILLPVRIDGISMLPTYRDHGVNFINRLAYLGHEPQRGDVVGVRFAGPHVMLLKRIVGMPGETIEFSHGRVYIDGKELPEPYVKLPCNWSRAPEKIEPGKYFVVGDNRSMPKDMHEFGSAERRRIMGKVLL
jgi:signal peptidase I